jgi:uncharacterized protein
VIFLIDIDGTLLRTHRAGRRALERAFDQCYGRPDALDEISFGGMTDPLILDAALVAIGQDPGAENNGRVLAAYLPLLEDEIARCEYEVLPGVRQLVQALSSLPQSVLGLGTGNVEEGARIKLSRGGLDAPFLFGGFGSDATHRRDVIAAGIEKGTALLGHAVPPWAVTIVGDTPKDVAAARANGARCIGVATGTATAQSLREALADFVFGDLAETGAVCAITDRAPEDDEELASLIHASPLLTLAHLAVCDMEETDAAHDLGHVRRVALWAARLFEREDRCAPIMDVIAAALLHDIVNVPKNSPHRQRASELSAVKAQDILSETHLGTERTNRICNAIRDHSYSRRATPGTALGRALQDADRLEALGAIGIARTFATAAKMNSAFAHPTDPWAQGRDLDDRSYAVDHFFAKLLGLPSTFHTEAGTLEATRRCKRLTQFLSWFGDELGIPTPRPT